MNELDLFAAVLVSSGAGWYAGHYYERRKARAAFREYSVQMAHKTMDSMGKVFNAAVSVFMEKDPASNPEEILHKIIAEGNKLGLSTQVVNSQEERDNMIRGAMNDR